MYMAHHVDGEGCGGLSTLCHGYGFNFQQRVLKSFLVLGVSARRMG